MRGLLRVLIGEGLIRFLQTFLQKTIVLVMSILNRFLQKFLQKPIVLLMYFLVIILICRFLYMAYSIQLSSHHNATLQIITGLANLDVRRIFFSKWPPEACALVKICQNSKSAVTSLVFKLSVQYWYVLVKKLKI
jgi:hypothetical protein